MSNGEWRVFGRFNALDVAGALVLALCLSGFLLARAGHAGVNSAIKGTRQINIDICFTGVKTHDVNLFKVGEPAALTIRNQPVYPPMKIVHVETHPKLMAFLSPDGKKVVALPDATCPIANDFEVTVTDKADITDDGYVVRGNKLKVGNLVELEGFKYRVQGVVCDITPAQ